MNWRSLPPRVRRILADVSEETQIPPDEIVSRRRVKPIRLARMETVARVRELKPQPSYPRIAMWFQLHHTTCINAVQRMRPEVEA